MGDVTRYILPLFEKLKTYIARTHDGENVCKPEQRNDNDQGLGCLQMPPIMVHRGLRVELGEHNLKYNLFLIFKHASHPSRSNPHNPEEEEAVYCQ